MTEKVPATDQRGVSHARSVPRRVADAVRDSNSVARIGGDEFAVVLPELADRNEAREVARRVLETLTEPIRTDAVYAPEVDAEAPGSA